MKANSITKNQLIATQATLTHSFFATKGYSRIFELTNIDTIYSALIGITIGIFIILIFHKLGKNINHNLNDYLNKHKTLKTIYYPILFLFYFICILYPIISLSSLVNSYYLTSTNVFLIIIPFILLIYYLSLKEKQIIYKSIELVFPFIIIISIISIFALLPQINIQLYTPILTSKPIKILSSAIIFALFSSIPSFFTIDEDFPFKNRVEGYLIGTVSIFAIIFFITGILGKYFMSIYSYPEYMTLKSISMLSFIENIENVLYIPGYFYIFDLCTISLYKINKLQKNKKHKILSIISIIIIIFLTGHIFNKNYSLILLASQYIIYILGIFFILLGPILYLITKKLDPSR